MAPVREMGDVKTQLVVTIGRTEKHFEPLLISLLQGGVTSLEVEKDISVMSWGQGLSVFPFLGKMTTKDSMISVSSSWV